MGKIMLEFGMKLIPWLQTLHKDTEYVRINVHSVQESVKKMYHILVKMKEN